MLLNGIKIRDNMDINETEYNYHIGDIKDVSKVRPYLSDNKRLMRGRDTGHFGSGLYFSTYNGKYSSYGEGNNDKHLVNISGNIYRVDFGIYKNLYKVDNSRQGDMLFNMMHKLNTLYYKVFDGDYNCRLEYMVIKRNSSALGLHCPTYIDLLRMAQLLSKNDGDIRSFSTLYMEYNGYNGVNVSGVSKYDNTLHGSVIYDLSKVSKGSIERIGINNSMVPHVDASVSSSNELDDIEYDILRGKGSILVSSMGHLSSSNVMKLLKSSSYIVDDIWNIRKYYGDLFFERYLRIIYNKCLRGEILNISKLYESRLIKVIYEAHAWYFINLPPIEQRSIHGSILLSLIDYSISYDDGDTIKEILSYLDRDLTIFEEGILRKWLA